MSKRILLFPGIGDVHWVFLKLQAWLAARGSDWELPEVSIWNIDNRPRTLEFLQYVPWVKIGGYWDRPLEGELHRVFHSLYIKRHPTDSVLNFEGWDAVIGTNGNMRSGLHFNDVLEGAAINHAYGPVLPESAERYGQEQAARSPYVVLGFSGYGMFERQWCARMGPDKIKALVRRVRKAMPEGTRFLFTGCSWDDKFARKCLTPEDEMLVGKTTLPEFLSLIKHASLYMGWCGGNAILSQHLGTPTVAWWSRAYFPYHDRNGWETPHATKRHLILEVEDYRLDTASKVITFWKEARS